LQESKISESNSKAATYENFKTCINKNENSINGLSEAYEEKFLRKIKLREKINTQRTAWSAENFKVQKSKT